MGAKSRARHVRPDEFAAGVVANWGLPISPVVFLERFRRWPEALYDGARELVNTVRSRMRVGCLTSTNTVHWEAQGGRWGLERLFDVRSSPKIGLVKPDRDLFEYVSNVAGCPNESFVFLDDNPINVDQAWTLGIQVQTVREISKRTALFQPRDALIALDCSIE